MRDSYSSVPSRDDLERLAGGRAFARGEEYFEEGRVGPLAHHDGGVRADVLGSEIYRAWVAVKDGEVRSSCTCPVGADGKTCKHCVAVGLAWIADAWDVPTVRDGADTLAKYVRSLAQSDLAEYVLGLAASDEHVREQLELRASAASPKGPDVPAMKKSFDRAIRVRGFVDWREMPSYARGVERAIDTIEEVLSAGAGTAAIELAEHALARVEKAIESVDDDGQMRLILDRLEGIHHAACLKARPDPEVLARHLFKWRLESSWDVFHDAATSYADVFGARGSELFAKLTREAWERLPALGPSDRDRSFEYGRFRLRSAMEDIAEASGDIDALVAVLAKDLSSQHAYLQIGEALRGAGRDAEALAWAERGARAFPRERLDGRLREFLAESYEACGRGDEAMALMWEAFENDPGVGSFEGLKTCAARVGGWPAWREKTVALLTRRATEAEAAAHKGARGSAPWVARGNRSTLVRVLLADGDMDAAWRAAHDGECDGEVWHGLAKAREESDPAGASTAYRRYADSLLVHANPSHYPHAAEMAARVRDLLVRSGRAEEAECYLRDLRESQKRRRRFLEELDRATRA